jgi:hypothetical protein
VIHTTMNGRDTLAVAGGILRAEGDEAGRTVALRLADEQGETVWTTERYELAPEPALTHASSNTADYVATVWPQAGLVVLVGWSAAVLVHLSSGRTAATFPLAFAGKASLEQVGAQVSPDGSYLAITSTKLLWVVDRDLAPVLRYEPRFLFAELPAWQDGRVRVTEYDFDANGEIVVHDLEPRVVR